MTINQAKHYKKINISDFISDSQGGTFDIKPFLRLLWMYRWVLLVGTLLGALVGMHMASKQTPVYQSTLSMLVQPQFANLAQVGQGFIEERSYRYYETQYKIIRSRVVLQKVAEQLKLIGENSPYHYTKNQNILFKWLSLIPAVSDMANTHNTRQVIQFGSVESAVRYLRGNLRMLSSDETELLEIKFSSANSELSADVANTTAVAYQEYIKGTKVDRVDQASSWLEKQLITIKSELTDAELELQAFRSKEGAFGTKSLTSGTEKSLDNLGAVKTLARTNYVSVSQRYGERHPKLLAAKAELDAAEFAYSRGSRVAMKDRSKEFDLVRLEEKVESARNLYNMFLQRFQEANKSTDVQLNDSTIVDYALPAKKSSNMTGMKTIFLYIALGFLSCITLVILRFHFDNTYKSHHKLEKHLGFSVLGVLPRLAKNFIQKKSVPSFYRKRGCAVYTENVNRIRSALEFGGEDDSAKVIQLTSSIEGEGKSTLSYNLALSCAYMGKKSIIIDADMRRPQLHNVVSSKAGKEGLSDWLKGKCSLSEIIKESRDNKTLNVITSGSNTKSPLELISSSAMKKLIDALGEHYDCVIVDSPPVLPVADALELGKLSDAVILVVESGRTESTVLREAVDELADAGITPMGTVLSKQSETASEYYYPRRNYGYGYAEA